MVDPLSIGNGGGAFCMRVACQTTACEYIDIIGHFRHEYAINGDEIRYRQTVLNLVSTPRWRLAQRSHLRQLLLCF